MQNQKIEHVAKPLDEQIPVSSLDGALLDYWVARAEGWVLSERGVWIDWFDKPLPTGANYQPKFNRAAWHPTKNWSHGGPIVEREEIELRRGLSWGEKSFQWGAAKAKPTQAQQYARVNFYGETPLIAAMRAYVASKFGDFVGREE